MLDGTPLLRLFEKYRLNKLSTTSVVDAQRRVLNELISKSISTKFGIDHGFRHIKNVTEYQRQVPLRKYEDFWNLYWKDEYPIFSYNTWPGVMPYFALSSGTSSGTTKYIPISHEMIRSNSKAGLDSLCYHVRNRPSSKIFGGKSLVLGGSTDLREELPGVFSGDLSGIIAKTIPWWAKSRYFPCRPCSFKNWEEKVYRIGSASLKEDIRTISGVPSWLLIFLNKIREFVGKPNARLVDLYPNLEMLVHGGVNFQPYFSQFEELLEGSHAELREVYPASEGFIAVADRGYGEGLRLLTDNGVFFEFIPKSELNNTSPTRHWVQNIELDTEYAITLSTCAGLWSYILGDTVKFVDLNPPRLLITGRISYYLSAFGEHLIDEEIEKAISLASRNINNSVTDFSVGPIFPKTPNELGGHVYIVEFSNKVNENSIGVFAKILDDELRRLNEDYDAHRANGYGLNPPKILPTQPGTFMEWMRSRGKLGGQNKVPRIINDSSLLQSLLDVASKRGSI